VHRLMNMSAGSTFTSRTRTQAQTLHPHSKPTYQIDSLAPQFNPVCVSMQFTCRGTHRQILHLFMLYTHG
jgi:hypothetical protein